MIENENNIDDIIERRTKPPLIRQLAAQPGISLLSFLDNLDQKQITTNLFNEKSEDEEKLDKIIENYLICRHCKKEFTMRYTLEKHLLACADEKIKQLEKENKQLQIKLIEMDQEYDNDIQRIIKYVDYTDKKWIKLCQENYEEMRRIVELDL